MRVRVLWCLCIIWTTVLSEKSSSRGLQIGRIIGGQQAEAGRFPSAAAIYVTTNTSNYFCGGTLLGNQWVVTAAQCVDKATSFIIKLGSNTLTKNDPNRVTLASSHYVIHPEYDAETLDNDIGLIELRIPIQFTDYIKSVEAFPWYDHGAGTWYQTIGWGQTSDDDPQLNEYLHWVSVTSISLDECKITYGDQITENMLCAAGNYNEGTCIGDTGSPLFYLIRGGVAIHGVASFVSGNGCESPHPSGYSSIYRHVDWLRNITGFLG